MIRLAAVCERIAATNSRNRKIALLVEYLNSLEDPDFVRAVRFLSGDPLDDAKIAVGGSLLRDAAVAVTGWDLDLVRLCLREVGDTGEAISLLLAALGQTENLTLKEAESVYLRLAAARKTARKLSVLIETFQRYDSLAIRYFIKAITGNLRIGLQARMVREAASATGRALPDLAPAVFRPIDFMLAKPLEQAPEIANPSEWVVEDKYDGIRAQAHVANGTVRLYSRGMEEITDAFPDVAEPLRSIEGTAIFDGEILAWRNDRALAFSVLQQRIARKKVPAAIRDSVPVIFMGYDLLFRNGESYLEKPLIERRAALERIGVRVSPQEGYGDASTLDRRFTAARERGNEGLLLKQVNGVYEPGRRSGSWIKVKRPYATLDVVVTVAEQGHGRRATVLSDYTFAVRDGDAYLNVGKAYSGLTDEEIRELTRIFRAITTERFGRVSLVKPEVVLEVAFDGIQTSPRHKSGYALRFPRIVQWRRDKTVAGIDTIDQVRALHEASLRA